MVIYFLLLKLGYSNKTNNPNDSPRKRRFGLFSCGRTLLIILLTIPMWFISPLFLLFSVALGCLIGFMRYQEVLDFVKKRRKMIEREIPRFTSALT